MERGLRARARAKAVRGRDMLTLGLNWCVLRLNRLLLGVSELVRTETISIDVTVVLVAKQRFAVHYRLSRLGRDALALEARLRVVGRSGFGLLEELLTL